MPGKKKRTNRAGLPGAGAPPNEAPLSNQDGGLDHARALGDELEDLRLVAGVIATAVATRLGSRLVQLRAGLETSTDAAVTEDQSADAAGRPPSPAAVRALLDELEALRLRPERGRWKDLRRIARFVDRAEKRLASGHRPAARTISSGTEFSRVEGRVP